MEPAREFILHPVIEKSSFKDNNDLVVLETEEELVFSRN